MITASGVAHVSDALLAVSFPAQVSPKSPDLEAFLRVAPLCQAVRRTGSAALNLAYVACGRLDAHWAHVIHPWDAAAGVLLVQEAGGVVTDFSGGDNFLFGKEIVASAPGVHAEFLSVIRQKFSS